MNRVDSRTSRSSGSALARARMEAGLTQRQLGDAAGMTHVRIGQLETKPNQRPLYDNAEKIARALGRTVADFWPTLQRAVAKGRLLDTVIPFNRALRRRTGVAHGVRLVFADPEGGKRIRHTHRPPLCCGVQWCRCVVIDDPETYPVFGDPALIEFASAGGA